MHKFLFLLIFCFSILQAQDLPFEQLILHDKEVKNAKPFQKSGYFVDDQAMKFYDASLTLVKTYEGEDYENMFVNKNGMVTYTFKGFVNGVRKNENRKGFINEAFEFVIPCDYKEITTAIHIPYIIAKTFEDQIIIFDRKGNQVCQVPDFALVSRWVASDPFIFTYKKNKKRGVMNFKGEVLLDFSEEDIFVSPQDVYQNNVAFRVGDEVGLMNLKGEVLWKTFGFELKHIKEGIYSINNHKDLGFQIIDQKGKLLSKDYFCYIPQVYGDQIYFKQQPLQDDSHTIGVYDKNFDLVESYEYGGYNELIDAYELKKVIYIGGSQGQVFLKDGQLWAPDDFYKNYADQAYGQILPRRKQYLFGFVDKNLNYKITPQYKYISTWKTSQKIMRVRKENQEAVIDLQGKEIIPYGKYKIHITEQGLIYVKGNEQLQLFDLNGKSLIPPSLKLRSVTFYTDGIISIYLESLTKSNPVIPNSPDEELVMRPVPKPGGFKSGFQYIDQSGKLLFSKSFDSVGPFINGVAKVRPHGNQPEMLINKQGETYLGDFDESAYLKAIPRYRKTTNDLFPKDFILKNQSISIDPKTREFLNDEGEIITAPPFTRKMLHHSKGLSVIDVIHGFMRYETSSQTFNGPFFINHPSHIFNGYYLTEKDKKFGITNDIGQEIVPPVLDKVIHILDGKANVRFQGKFYLLNLER